LRAFFVRAVGLCVCFAPDRNRSRGKSTRTFDSKNAAVCRESWLVELLTSCEDDAEGHEFDPSGGPVSVRNRALARAGPTDLQDDRLAPRAGACHGPPSQLQTPARRPGQERSSWRPTRLLAREGGRGLMSRLSPPHRYSSGGCCGTRVTGSAGKGARMQAKCP
jgi:hypothetical protein